MLKGISATLVAITIISVVPANIYAQGIMETGGLYGGVGHLAGHANALSKTTKSLANYRYTVSPNNKSGKPVKVSRELIIQRAKEASEYFDKAQKAEKAGRLVEAENYYWQSLYIRQNIWGQQDKSLVDIYNKIADLLVKQNKLKDAQQFYRQALAMQAKKFGPGAVELLPQLQKMAVITTKQKNFSDAIYYNKDILVLQEKKFGPNTKESFIAINNLVNSYMDAGRYDEAEQLLNSKKSEQEKATEPNKDQMLTVLDSLEQLYRKTNRASDADQIQQKIQSLMGNNTANTQAPVSGSESTSTETVK